MGLTKILGIRCLVKRAPGSEASGARKGSAEQIGSERLSTGDKFRKVQQKKQVLKVSSQEIDSERFK